MGKRLAWWDRIPKMMLPARRRRSASALRWLLGAFLSRRSSQGSSKQAGHSHNFQLPSKPVERTSGGLTCHSCWANLNISTRKLQVCCALVRVWVVGRGREIHNRDGWMCSSAWATEPRRAVLLV